MRKLQIFLVWIWSLVRRRDPQAITASHNKIPACLVMGTAYDQFTEHTVKWLTSAFIQIERRSERGILLNQTNLSKGQVRRAMGSLNCAGRLEVFCGHGDFDALLGPPDAAPTVYVNGVLHSAIYDATMISQQSSSLIAFCCRSGRTLGRAYATYLEKGFIGFDSDLPLDFSPAFMEQLRIVFEGIVSSVVAAGFVTSDHYRILENCYDEAIFYFMDGEGRKLKDNFLFQMFLAEHRANIRVYTSHLPDTFD